MTIRMYHVVFNDKNYLINAKSQTEAVRYVVEGMTTVELAKPATVGRLVQSGVPIEDAAFDGEEDQPKEEVKHVAAAPVDKHDHKKLAAA